MISDIKKLRQKHLFDNYDMSGMDAAYDDPPVGRMGEDSSTRLPTARWPESSDLPNAPEPSFPPDFTKGIEHGVPEEEDEDARSARRLEEIFGQYKPDTTQNDRFNELLSQYPKDKGPSLGRTLVASALAVGDKGSIKESQDFLHHPHDSDIEDWKNKIQPEYQAANLERQENINNRTLAYNTAQAENARRRNEMLDQRYNDQAEAAIMRNLINKYKAEQYKIVTMGTRIKAVNPHDPNDVKDIGDSGKMDQRELEDLKGGYQVKAAEARGNATYAGTVTRETETYEDEAGNLYKDIPDAGGLQPQGDAPPKPVGRVTKVPTARTPSGKSDLEDFLKKRSAYLQRMYDQTKFREFITPPTTVNGAWQLKPPEGGRFSGVDPKKQKLYDELLGGMYGNAGKPPEEEEAPQFEENRPPIRTRGTPGYNYGAGLPPNSTEAGDIELKPQKEQKPRLRVMDPKTGKIGSIENSREEIKRAVDSGLRVEVGR